MPLHDLNNDPFAKPAPEQDFGTKHPSRYEPDQSTTSNTQPQQRMRVSVSLAANLAIVSGVATAITFDTVTFDTAGLFSSTKITIPTTGKVTGPWSFYGQVGWAGDVAGTLRILQIRANGATPISTVLIPPNALEDSQVIGALVNDPNPNWYYELIVLQDAGHNVNLAGGVDKVKFSAIHSW